MKRQMRLQFTIVSCLTVLTTAHQDYEDNLTKLWSLSSTSNSDGSAVVNVTSASIVIQPTNYGRAQIVSSRQTKDLKGTPPDYKYAFRSRAIPLQEEQLQLENNVYYSRNNVNIHNNKYKPEVYPGNYFQIAKDKRSNDNMVKDSPPNEVTFHPRAIPIIRDPELQGRSLYFDEEPIIEKPEGFSETATSRRSLSYVLGAEDDDEEPEEEDELADELGEEEDENKNTYSFSGKYKKKLGKKAKKITKYMMPLLLAYKLKYLALVPVMIAGLVLLVGATGLAGFFFALFAAVMGLQKGGY
ncbi:unnamed protein product [Parnassius mnemosyne]|uniref:Uncharacterized protein n=1 Tax=Parnassius mnemosyne TaxID=213953 RepID=A0AAV1LJS6_9NEOP